MNKNILYLAICAFGITGLVCSCNDDDPTYSDMALEKEELVVDMDQESVAKILVTDGNGNYKVTSSDENVATATVSGDTILIVPLKSGKTEIAVTDWARKTKQVEVTVTKLEELMLKEDEFDLDVAQLDTTTVYTGNGGYQVASSDEKVAKATITEDGQMVVEAVGVGEATLTVTDAKEKTYPAHVKVLRPLLLDHTGDVSLLVIEKPLKINILDGNGGYTVKSKNPAKVTAVIDGETVTLTGASDTYGSTNADITISDQAGKSITFAVKFIDSEYLSNLQKARCFIDETTLYQLKVESGSVAYSPEFNLCQISVGVSSSTFVVRYSGDLSVGAKDGVTWYETKKGVPVEGSEKPAGDFRVDKAEDGWYWVSFTTEGKTERSYMVAKKAE